MLGVLPQDRPHPRVLTPLHALLGPWTHAQSPPPASVICKAVLSPAFPGRGDPTTPGERAEALPSRFSAQRGTVTWAPCAL